MLSERGDIKIRFKKGQSGNPKGRPKGRNNNGSLLSDLLFKTITVRDNDRRRKLPKIVAAMEVCLNNALKGDLKAFTKIMEFAERWDLLRAPAQKELKVVVRRVIFNPSEPDKDHDLDEYLARADNNKTL